MKIIKFGWKKQQEDSRDFKFSKLVANKLLVTSALPSVVSNRLYCSEVEDQGDLGSCTANAWVGLLEYNENKNLVSPYRDFSRLFIYYNERVMEGTVGEDSGAILRDGAKSLVTYGVCPEIEWPYIAARFANKPTPQCYTDALANTIHSYYSLTTLSDMRTCLANGQCFVFGFSAYTYFTSTQMASTGVLNLPAKRERNLGGHAVLAVGYDDVQQRILCKNSWGKGWGLPGSLAGYFTMPYAYITNPRLASDFWTVPLR